MDKLFDQFGREIQIGKKPEMREIAVTAVRDRWSQYPSYERIWKIGQPISQEHVSERFKIPLPADGETVLPSLSELGALQGQRPAFLIATKSLFKKSICLSQRKKGIFRKSIF